MFSKRSDLPLDKDAMGRFLPWLIAFMVFLAILAVAGMLVLRGVTERWDASVEGTLTIQVAPAATVNETSARLEAVLGIIAGKPEIRRYETLDDGRLMAMLEPWIGAGGDSRDLPIPRLIDVTLVPGAALDARALAEELNARVPGVAVDDHRVWLASLVRLVTTVEGVAWAVLAFVALTTAGTVVFATRTGLAIHRDAIEVLHLIGAQDSYIAAQFGARALSLGLRGGILGLIIAVPTLVAIGYFARATGDNLLPDLELAYWQGGVVVALPVAVALLAMITARMTVKRNLKRML